jgi:hypothetical protein
MKKEILFISVSVIFFGIYILFNDFIYDSSFGAKIDVSTVKYPLGGSLILLGLFLLYSIWRKNNAN